MSQRTSTRSVSTRGAASTAKPASSKRIIWIVVPAAILVTAAATFFLVTLLNGKNKDVVAEKDNRPTLVTQDNAQAVKADMNMDKPVPDGSYQVTMNTDWVFSGKSSNAYIENSKHNTRTVYFDVTRSDTNELLYSSPYIPVGEKIKGFVLSAPPAKGSYKALVTYHLVDDNHKEVSNLSVKVNIEVK